MTNTQQLFVATSVTIFGYKVDTQDNFLLLFKKLCQRVFELLINQQTPIDIRLRFSEIRNVARGKPLLINATQYLCHILMRKSC